MKKSVYFDTSIPSFLFDDRESIQFQRGITWKWWRTEAERYQVWISEFVLAELTKGDYPNKKQTIQFAMQLPVLPHSPEIGNIVESYINNYLMPKDTAGDAMHLAYASFHNIDFLMTWNCDHLANGNKRQLIRIINASLNLRVPEILTPLELFEEQLQ